MRRFFFFAFLFLLSLVVSVSSWQNAFADSRRNFDEHFGAACISHDDPQLAAAAERARNSIFIFMDIRGLGKIPGPYFQVKSLFVPPSGTEEYAWFVYVETTLDGDVMGIEVETSMEPSPFEDVAFISTDPCQIVDWRYIDDGQWRGGFTERVLLDRMSAEQRGERITDYHDNPLPEGATVE